MLENAEAVVESLIAELRDGRRVPDGPPPGLEDRGLRDAQFLEQVQQVLHEYRDAGRLDNQEFEALRLRLGHSASSRTRDDQEATVELDVPTPPVPEPARGGRPAQAVELRRGSVLRDRYVLGEPVGSGGLSIVFRARDLRRDPSVEGDRSEVALKVLRQELRASEAANGRLKREFRQTQALRHPGIVRMFDLDCDGDTWFIIMEMLVGTSLDGSLRQLPAVPVDVAEALRVASACADVLAFAHRQGAVHGDFKPGNVFLTQSGAVKVLDFGTAPESPQAAVDVVVPDRTPVPRAATRAYASPEVLAGEAAEPRDDVFSLACVVYELLTGRHPFGRLPANKARDLGLAATPLPQLYPAQNAALASGLAWTRAERPSTVEAFMRSLISSSVEAEPLPAELRPPVDRSAWWAWLGVLVATVLLLVVLWPILSNTDRNASTRTFGGAAPDASRAPTVLAPMAPTLSSPDRDSTAEPPSPSTTNLRALPEEQNGTPAPAAAVAPTRATAPAAQRARAQVGADSASVVVSEGTHAAVVLLRREANLAASVQVAWRLSSGSARLQEDFEGPASGTTRFLPGQTTRAVYIPLINDARAEDEESFSLQLSSRSAAIGPTSEVTITIVDDDQ